MNLDQYQALAARTCNPQQTPEQVEDMAMLGLIGELGELTEIFKKKIFHDKPATADRVREEAGDFLWYLTLAATQKGVPFSEWAGVPSFDVFDDAATESLAKTIEQKPTADPGALCESPVLFYQLAKAITSGGVTVPQCLTILAVILKPYGGLAWAARDNVRKLEARHNVSPGDLEAVPPAPPADAPEASAPVLTVVETTTPGGNE